MWAVLTFFAAILPFIGAPLIWFPIAILRIIEGFLGKSNYVYSGVGLLLWGFLLVSTIDNIIKPKIIGDRAKLHPLIVFLGIIAGLKLFGFIGIIVGPVICAIAVSIINLHLKHGTELWLRNN